MSAFPKYILFPLEDLQESDDHSPAKWCRLAMLKRPTYEQASICQINLLLKSLLLLHG